MKVLKVGVKLIFIIAVSVVCQSTFAVSDSPAVTEKFLSVADIHFTPFTSCKVARLTPCPLILQLIQADYGDWQHIFENDENKNMSHYGQDTNYLLLKSSLAEIKKRYTAENPAFTLLLGDFLAHNYREQYVLYSHDRTQEGYNRFVKKTLQFLTAEIKQALPQGDIYPIIGNNDSYTGDYSTIPHGIFFQDTGQIWSALITGDKNLERFKKNFSNAGYYSVISPHNKDLRIIILNTILFSSSALETDKNAANAELNWLNKQLAEVSEQKQHAIIAFHIPVGIDVYRTLKNVFGGIQEFWQPDFMNQFQKTLQVYPGVVTAILPGHIHMDTFQVLSLNSVDDVPVSYTPSISPIFGNNPAFKIYSYDTSTLQLKNFETYYYSLSDAAKGWIKEYSFNSTYKSTCATCDLKKGMKELSPKNDLVKLFRQYYAVGKQGQPIAKDDNWKDYWCNIRSITKEDFQACISQ